MALYSSDGDKKLTIIVLKVVIELKNRLCVVFEIRGRLRKMIK